MKIKVNYNGKLDYVRNLKINKDGSIMVISLWDTHGAIDDRLIKDMILELGGFSYRIK